MWGSASPSESGMPSTASAPSCPGSSSVSGRPMPAERAVLISKIERSLELPHWVGRTPTR